MIKKLKKYFQKRKIINHISDVSFQMASIEMSSESEFKELNLGAEYEKLSNKINELRIKLNNL